jgi:hypothetical protein
MVIKDLVLEKVIENVRPDEKKRVVLKKVKIEDGVSYHIYVNKQGQILFHPQVTISASEAWLFNNPKALADIRQGLLESAQGKITKINMKEL